MNIEEIIKGLSPELQEKARRCGSVDELLALAKEERIPLPEEALAAVAGGNDTGKKGCSKKTCPKCGSKNTVKIEEYSTCEIRKCEDCGHKYQVVIMY